jgi:hypothetical protein
VLVVRKTSFRLHAVANFICIAVGILLWVLVTAPLLFISFAVQKIDNNDMLR